MSQELSEPLNWVAIDIGGTLAKTVCWINRVPKKCIKFSDSECPPLRLPCGRDYLCFTMSSRVCENQKKSDLPERLLTFLESLLIDLPQEKRVIRATGGGAVKFASFFEKQSTLRLSLIKIDEMICLVRGVSYLLNLERSLFTYNISRKCKEDMDNLRFESLREKIFPFLIVNIGSGVSILKVNGPEDFKRVSGTAAGGGTVMGLGSLMFGASSFDEIIELSKQGDARLVDLSVGDLMGHNDDDNCERGDLWSDNTLACSMGKLFTRKQNYSSDGPTEETLPNGGFPTIVDPMQVHMDGDLFSSSSTSYGTTRRFQRADVAQSLIQMVSYNIGYIAHLVAEIHGSHLILCSGKFVNKHVPTMASITYAIEWYQQWGQAEQQNNRTSQMQFQANTSECSTSATTVSASVNRPETPVSRESGVFNKFSACEPTLSSQTKALHDKKTNRKTVVFLHHEGYAGAVGALLVNID